MHSQTILSALTESIGPQQATFNLLIENDLHAYALDT